MIKKYLEIGLVSLAFVALANRVQFTKTLING